MNNPQSQVLEHLKSGRPITVGICYQLYHTHDCRRIISRLKKEGHLIGGEMLEYGGDRFKQYVYLGKME
jgi:hypothetical protein